MSRDILRLFNSRWSEVSGAWANLQANISLKIVGELVVKVKTWLLNGKELAAGVPDAKTSSSIFSTVY